MRFLPILPFLSLVLSGCSTIKYENVSSFRKVAVYSTFGQNFYGNYVGRTLFNNKEFEYKLPARGICPVIEKTIAESLENHPIEAVVVDEDAEHITIKNHLLMISEEPDIDDYLAELKSRNFDAFLLIHTPQGRNDFICGSTQNLEEMGLYSKQIILDRMSYAYACFSIYFYDLHTDKKHILGTKKLYRELYSDPWNPTYEAIPLSERKKIISAVVELSAKAITEEITDHLYPKMEEEKISPFQRFVKKPYEDMKYGNRFDLNDTEITPRQRYDELYREAIKNGEHIDQFKQQWSSNKNRFKNL